MPSTINGIGTWYYGQRNRFQRRGTCDQCGATADLKSYDTTLYFVFFFVPLVPIGGKRVLDECSACQKHKVLKLKEWDALKEEAVTKANAAVEADPKNPVPLIEALGAASGFQHLPQFEAFCEYADETFPNNPDVLSAVAGDGCTSRSGTAPPTRLSVNSPSSRTTVCVASCRSRSSSSCVPTTPVRTCNTFSTASSPISRDMSGCCRKGIRPSATIMKPATRSARWRRSTPRWRTTRSTRSVWPPRKSWRGRARRSPSPRRCWGVRRGRRSTRVRGFNSRGGSAHWWRWGWRRCTSGRRSPTGRRAKCGS